MAKAEPGETVRKASEALAVWPRESPQRGFSVHFACRILAKFMGWALLAPLFGQSLEGAFSEVRIRDPA